MEANKFGYVYRYNKEMMETNNLGYEYRYKIWLDDDIIPRCDYTPSMGAKTFLYEMRANFIFRTIEGVEERIGSETLNGSVKETDYSDNYLYPFLLERLREYLLPMEGFRRFVRTVIRFTDERASSNITPIVIGLDVCTVQKKGEAVGAARDRAIRPDILVPKYVTSIAYERFAAPEMILYLRGLRPIGVVKDVDEGFKLMNKCGLCGRNPTLGAHISVLRNCKHAFHWHCAVNWLERNESCPTCGVKDLRLD